MASAINDTILQDFSRNPDGQLCIRFSDPAYVRSDVIIYDRKDNSVHAVLHEASHFVGYLPKEFAGGGLQDVVLSAPHYFTGTVNLRAKVSVC